MENKKYKILFFSSQASVRGTEVALYDYANHVEKYFGHEAYITYISNYPTNHDSTVKKFKDRFGDRVIPFEVPGVTYHWGKHMPFIREKINEKVLECGADFFYAQKKGERDGVESDHCKNLILCCGLTCDPHGHKYAYISPWLARNAGGDKYPVVPPMIYLERHNENLREEFSIPSSDTVFARMGGEDTWNLAFANHVIQEVLKNREDCWFIFMNTPKFIDHPRVLFFPPNADMFFKTKFINTSDAMLHCRQEGESFGSTVAEFSTLNKPVITWFGSPERNHIEALGEKGIFYQTPQDLYNILLSFRPMPKVDWNAYKDLTPENVMKIFNDVFLS